MGSGSRAVLVLVAAGLAIAPPCALASSHKFGLDIVQPKLLSSRNDSFTPSSHVDFDPSKSKVFSYEGFLSRMECGHLVSTVIYPIIHRVIFNDGATNILAGLLFRLADSKDIVVSKIEDRISLWSFIPKGIACSLQLLFCNSHGESMQILKYGANKSDPNKEETQSSSGANRLVTFFMHLSDTPSFPIPSGLELNSRIALPLTGFTVLTRSLIAESRYTVKPVKGNVILLFNSRPDGISDKDNHYEACCVLEREKWLVIKHMHASKIVKSKPSPASEDDGCTDEDGNCVSWAAAGECDKNPVFMIGSPYYYGTCRKSCFFCFRPLPLGMSLSIFVV
ncbi:hypothetical protein VPH35_043410 [Triticum aestivum]